MLFIPLDDPSQNLGANNIKRIRSDHGGEFENKKLAIWYNELGIKHEFSDLKTPQQNGVAKPKNRTLLDMANVMLTSKNLTKRFWAKVVNAACYIIN